MRSGVGPAYALTSCSLPRIGELGTKPKAVSGRVALLWPHKEDPGEYAKGDGDGTTWATTHEPPLNWVGVQCSCPAPATERVASRKECPNGENRRTRTNQRAGFPVRENKRDRQPTEANRGEHGGNGKAGDTASNLRSESRNIASRATGPEEGRDGMGSAMGQ
jgi:hypothetical protein